MERKGGKNHACGQRRCPAGERRLHGQQPQPAHAFLLADIRLRVQDSHQVLRPIAPQRTSDRGVRSEEHTSELQSLMRISYAVFCLKKKTYTYYRNSTI